MRRRLELIWARRHCNSRSLCAAFGWGLAALKNIECLLSCEISDALLQVLDDPQELDRACAKPIPGNAEEHAICACYHLFMHTNPYAGPLLCSILIGAASIWINSCNPPAVMSICGYSFITSSWQHMLSPDCRSHVKRFKLCSSH